MKVLKLFFVILFVFAIGSVFSAPYDMISVGDPVLNDLFYLSLETGNSILSFTPPVAPGEIRIFLKTPK